MKVFIVLLLGLAAANADKIVGGTDADGPISYQVRIQYDSGSIRCGASLISKNWVVSAAHCKGTIPSQWQSWSIVVGYYNGGFKDNSQTRSVISQIVNEYYNSATLDNDIMLLQLNSDVSTNSDVGTIALPTQGVEVTVGTPCTVSGWGTTSSGGSTSSHLQKVTVNVVSTADCNAKFSYDGDITDNMFCLAIDGGGYDACQGDSGGPAECKGVLEGIVSWGYGCADARYPGVYTRVSQYRDWIKRKSSV